MAAHEVVAAGVHAEEGTRRYLALPFFRDGIRLRTRYIDDAAIDASLRFMAKAAPRSRVVFTFGMESYAERVARAGFRVREEIDGAAMWRRYLPGEPPDGAAYSMCAIIDRLRC